MSAFDRRLTPARADLAAAHLSGMVTADRFVTAQAKRVAVPVADLRARPSADCSLDSQSLLGEEVDVYDEEEGWAWVQLRRDGYVGYLSADALGPVDPAPTHEVAVLRTLVFPGADLKLPIAGQITQGARIAVRDMVETRGLQYARLPNGYAVVAKHLRPLDQPPGGDFVEVARGYVGTPYLWGGRTALGLDCSALVQTALAATGIKAPRDADMQEASVGEVIDWQGQLAALRTGDLLFWKGHVGIVSGPNRLLHANGFHMLTVEEALDAAIARIAAGGNEIRKVRRL